MAHVVFVLVLAACIVVPHVMAACPCNTSRVWNALHELHNSTSGPRWRQSDRWLSPGSEVCGWFGVLPDCTGLALPANGLDGTLPAALANFTELVRLDLSNNTLRGTLPPEYQNWTSAVNISLMHNALDGTLPPEYSTLSKLVFFDVSVNFLVGTLPPEFSTWTSMRTFRVFNNSIGGTLPTSYASWGTSLEELAIGNNYVTGTLPPEFSVFSSVQHFNVDGNMLWGSLPPQYGNWTALVNFLFNLNAIGGTLPPQYSAFTNLQRFIGDYNYAVEGTLPPEYSTWSRVITFSMAGNRLRGTLPPEYGGMKSMQYFQVSINQLNGTLPPEYSAWTSLVEFSASLNTFSGTLPPEYSTLSTMTMFHVAGNTLSGTLPPSYGLGWAGMQHLFVNTNQLRGTLPEEYSNMRSMIHVTVNENRLEGQLPSSLGQWSNLQLFVASDNRLNGTLPGSFSNWPNGVTMLLDNNQLTGTLPVEWTGKVLFVLTLHNNWNLRSPIPAAMSVPLIVTLCNTSVCGDFPQGWSMGTTTRACQPVTAGLVNSVASGNFGAIIPVFTPLPPCPITPAPTKAPTTGTPTTASPNSTAPQDASSLASGAVRASSGITTTTLAVATILPLMTAGIPSGFSVGATVRVSSLASRVASRRLYCGSAAASTPQIDGSAEDDGDAIGSFLGDNPTTLSLPGRLSLAGGTVVGNTLLLAVAPVVLGIAAVSIRRLVGKLRERNAVVDLSRPVPSPLAVVRHCVRAHMVVYSWVTVPTTAATVVLLEAGFSGSGGGSSAAAVLVGVLGLVAVLFPFALQGATWLRFRSGLAPSVAAQSRRRSAALERCDVVEYLSSERAAWAPLRGLRKRQRHHVQVGLPSQVSWCLLDESLRSCAFPHHYTFLVDFVSSVAQGALAGAASSPSTPCAAVGPLLWLLVSVAAAVALFEAVVRPRATLLDQAIALVMAAWSVFICASASAGMSDAAAVATVAQAAAALCCVLLQFSTSLVARGRAAVQRAAEIAAQRTVCLAAAAHRRVQQVQCVLQSIFLRSSNSTSDHHAEATARQIAQLRSLRPTSAELLGALLHLAVEQRSARAAPRRGGGGSFEAPGKLHR